MSFLVASEKIFNGKGIAVCETSPHRYVKSLAIWDHIVLPATRQR